MISRDEVKKFLNEKIRPSECNVCGKQLMGIPSDDLDETWPLVCQLITYPGKIVPVVLTCCMNCANTNFFSIKEIERSIENMKNIEITIGICCVCRKEVELSKLSVNISRDCQEYLECDDCIDKRYTKVTESKGDTPDA